MISKKILDQEIENLIGLSNLVNAFEEIAATRIKRTRDSVLINRAYSSEIHEIFIDVILSYKRQVETFMRMRKKKSLKNLTFLNKNGRTLYLLISANTGLYGGIIKRTFDLFLKSKRDQNCDIAIIGKLGLSMWKEHHFKDRYYYFDFPDQRVDDTKLREIINFIINYEKIIVFYGQFQNLIKQEATFSDISGNVLSENESQKGPQVKYFFEPSLERIMEFFEKQIFASIFEQTVRESQLAKIASRLTALDRATENIDKELEKLKFQYTRLTHQIQNKKQLETFSTRLLWNKR